MKKLDYIQWRETIFEMLYDVLVLGPGYIVLHKPKKKSASIYLNTIKSTQPTLVRYCFLLLPYDRI